MRLHERLQREEGASPPTERRFGFVFAAVFALTAVYRAWHGRPGGAILLVAGLVFAALALWWPAPLRPLSRAWLRLGQLLHAVVNPVVMALLFVLSVVPTALLLRLFGKDLLRLKREPVAPTYWIRRDPNPEPPRSMTDQF